MNNEPERPAALLQFDPYAESSYDEAHEDDGPVLLGGCLNPEGREGCDAQMCRLLSDLIAPQACFEARPDDGDEDDRCWP